MSVTSSTATKATPGGHPPIIDPEVFDKVQALLDTHVVARRVRAIMPGGSPLAGLIVDADGIGMTPTVAYGKLGRKYRYYVSHPLQVGGGKDLDRDVVRRVAAGAIEALVMERLTTPGLIAANADWKTARQVLRKVHLNRHDVTISVAKGDLGPAAIAAIRDGLPIGQKLVEINGKSPRLDLVIPGRPVFRGGRTWLASPDGASLARRASADPTLLHGLKRAHRILAEHHASPISKPEVNRDARGIDDSYLRSIAGLAFLAPDIQAAIVNGRQPVGLTLEILHDMKMPIAWEDQRTMLGFSGTASL